MITLEPLGEQAYLVRFPDEDAAARWASAVRSAGLPGVVEVIAAYRTAAVLADYDRAEPDELEAHLRAIEPDAGSELPGQFLEIPVLYDGEDLEAVASALGLEPGQVVADHTAPVYRVFAVGFLPGFPYAGYLPPSLCGIPRRSTPRTRVPAGSIAIVGRQTGIYPSASPGGWHLLGRTPLVVVDMAEGYFPIRSGDRLRFRAINRDEFEARRGERLCPGPDAPSI